MKNQFKIKCVIVRIQIKCFWCFQANWYSEIIIDHSKNNSSSRSCYQYHGVSICLFAEVLRIISAKDNYFHEYQIELILSAETKFLRRTVSCRFVDLLLLSV